MTDDAKGGVLVGEAHIELHQRRIVPVNNDGFDRSKQHWPKNDETTDILQGLT